MARPKVKHQPTDDEIVAAVRQGIATATGIVTRIAERRPDFDAPGATNYHKRLSEASVVDRPFLDEALARLSGDGVLVTAMGGDIPRRMVGSRTSSNWKFYMLPEKWQEVVDTKAADLADERRVRAEAEATETIVRRHMTEWLELVDKYLAE